MDRLERMINRKEESLEKYKDIRDKNAHSAASKEICQRFITSWSDKGKRIHKFNTKKVLVVFYCAMEEKLGKRKILTTQK